MSIKLKIPTSNMKQEFQAQMVGGIPPSQSIQISLGKASGKKYGKFKMNVRGNKFSGKKGLNLT
jgi:hypothetical protein